MHPLVTSCTKKGKLSSNENLLGSLNWGRSEVKILANSSKIQIAL